jgi:hydrogenase-1 operon protein HyaF
MEKEGYRAEGARLSLAGVDAEILDEVNEVLGSGEVSALITEPQVVRIQESAFAGLWRMQATGEGGRIASDFIEVGPIPNIVLDALARVGPYTREPATPGPGVMNGPSLLQELISVSKVYRAGEPSHVVNLALLPVTRPDLDYLAEHLGRGPVTIVSRGYRKCRITSTALPYAWWVQYFNSTDELIVNTLEVVDVPVVALAGEEDFEDSIERLREWLAN